MNIPSSNLEGVRRMPKMGISVDDTTHKLLKRYGGQRHIGSLIGRMVRQFEKDEIFGSERVNQRLDRIEQRLIDLIDGKEGADIDC